MRGITYFRKRLGLSGDAFGALVGVTRSTVSKWESGKRAISKRHMQLFEEIFHEKLANVLTIENICINIEATEFLNNVILKYHNNNSNIMTLSLLDDEKILEKRVKILEAENYILKKERELLKVKLNRIKKILKGDYSNEQT